jgi:hypothetical protein
MIVRAAVVLSCGRGGDAVADPAHHPLDALVVDVDPGVLQLGRDTRGPVGAVGLLMDLPYPPGQPGIDPRSRQAGRGGLQPPVKTGPGDLQHPAQPLDAERAAMIVNELEAAQDPSINYCVT